MVPSKIFPPFESETVWDRTKCSLIGECFFGGCTEYFTICCRDLKMENIMLDRKMKQVKIVGE